MPCFQALSEMAGTQAACCWLAPRPHAPKFCTRLSVTSCSLTKSTSSCACGRMHSSERLMTLKAIFVCILCFTYSLTGDGPALGKYELCICTELQTVCTHVQVHIIGVKHTLPKQSTVSGHAALLSLCYTCHQTAVTTTSTLLCSLPLGQLLPFEA